MTESIIIDCDPGQDDAVMLLLAIASPEQLNIAGISTVAGNVAVEKTQRNARIICDLAGHESLPVYAGSAAPLTQTLVTAEEIHGESGLDGIEIEEPNTPLQKQDAIDFIIKTLHHSSSPITLVATGPLTNIATAIQRDPGITDKIKQIVLMGGAMREGGNITPSAEFNIYVDAVAADIVFSCGRPITVASLDITHQALVTPTILARIKKLDSAVAEATAAMLGFFNRYDSDKYAVEGAPLHDPCTIAYLLKPELFKGKTCNVSIETKSPLTIGHTAVDFWHVTDKPKNTNWLYEIETEKFYDLLLERLAYYS